MPPTVEEKNAFLADTSSQAYPKLVDKLLADPRYGERWGRHWLDLVRYAETDGLEDDQPLGNAWRYRDWVVDALNADMPYDQFVTRQLAGGDAQSRTGLILTQDPQSYIPTAFLRLGPWDAGSIPPLENRQVYLDDVTAATGSVFLGLTIGCARCHDHKYDPIPTDDYYRLQAFFNAIKIEDVDVPFRNKAFAAEAAARTKEYEQRLESGAERKAVDELENALLEKLRAKKLDDARARGWTVLDVRLELRRTTQTLFTEAERDKHQELTEAFDRVQDPEEKEELARFEEVLLRRLREAPGLDPTARYAELTVRDLKAELRDPSQTVFSEAERLRHKELSARVALIRRQMARYGTRALSVVNVPGPPNGPGIPATHVLVGGDFRHPGKPVEPGFPSAITGNSEPAKIELDRYTAFPTRGRRRTLAGWIASPDNPLTARVMVNRIWQHHFGRGIVETASDFGRNGSRPTHPELLDWLALKLVDEKWSIKAMHRVMLNSSTYRQASANPAFDGNTSDPENTLLWRFRTRRLDAEEIRDSILWTSGRLSLTRGGPSVFPPMASEVADMARNPAGVAAWEANEREEDSRRRSIYTFQRRSLPHPLMLAFDAPVFNESCERRSVTTTPLQALSMLNDGLINEEAAHLAARVEHEAGTDRGARIARVFEIVLSRPPQPVELERLLEFTGTLRDLCRVLLNSNEFVYVD
jgi:hypothetical protein